jgi:hypothetical protein
MPDDKIIISFDDEEDNRDSREKNDVLDLNVSGEENITGEIKQEKEYIPYKPEYSGYKSDFSLTGFNTSALTYPAGNDRCFRALKQIELKDEFINNLFQTYDNLILTSLNGNVYIVNKQKTSLINKFTASNARFEKTGFSYKDKAYINTINAVYSIDEGNIIREIYKSEPGCYIWNNLNCIADDDSVLIVVNEYNPDNKNGNIFLLNPDNKKIISPFSYSSNNIIPGKISVYNNSIIFFSDRKLHILNYKNNEVLVLEQDNLNEDAFDFLVLNNRLYYYKDDNKIYYRDLNFYPQEEKYTGININGINSLLGFKNYLFAGSRNGWYVYDINGLMIHNYQDANEFNLLQLNENILIASSGKYIYYANLTVFQETEKYLIASFSEERLPMNYRINSAAITEDKIFTLTSNGILTAFSNDLLNVNV